MSNDFIGIESEGNLICNEQKLVELFNEHYINIVEKSSGKKTLVTRKFFKCISRWNDSWNYIILLYIISVYSNHPRIRKLKNLCGPVMKINLICHMQAQATSIR